MISFSLRDNFGQGVFWNLISFGILGISGILLNIIIGRFYGPASLGIFNQVFALYIFISQFAVFGLHFSVLKHVSEHSHDRNLCSIIIISSLIVAIFSATIFCVISFLASGLIGYLFNSQGLVRGWLWVIPGLWFFAINKVLLAVVNGFMHMRAFAAAQASRYVLMVVSLALCSWMNVDGEILSIIISIAELILFLFLALYTLKLYSLVSPRLISEWAKKHIIFGTKSFLSGTMIELNSRVDVIMLGIFVSDAWVGIYSMASLVVEGFAQLAVVLRNNLNPLLTRYISKSQIAELKNVTLRVLKTFYPSMIVVCTIAIIGYPYFLEILVDDPRFMDGYTPFIILSVGLILCSGYLPFNMILIQAGYPGHHTIYMALILLTNAFLNAVLIPFYDINGAAVATGVSFVLSAVYLKKMVRRVLDFNL
jgi:O-antigen/teichoic acid export membrane protein